MKNKIIKQKNEDYRQYLTLKQDLETYQKIKIPLCAAETFVSDFVKDALSSEFEGKYCMNFPYLDDTYDQSNDFIGGKYIYRLFEMISNKCKTLFKAKYVDARALSGMNCVFVTLASLLKPGDNVLITDSEQGGHSSVAKLLKLLNITFDSIPYNYGKKEIGYLGADIDYVRLNELLKEKKYDAIIFAQSDLLIPADVSKIETDILIIYDATQTLGMIATSTANNPLMQKENIVLIGGTHKTLPGPTSGIIMTNNEILAKKLCTSVSPDILRNVQPNNIAGVLLSLLEMETFGTSYHSIMISNANYLAKLLEEKGYRIGKISDSKATHTHQIFIYTSKQEMEQYFNNACYFNVTLNKKEKKLFHNYGIRLGVQEITRYGWDMNLLEELANILDEVFKYRSDYSSKPIKSKIVKLTRSKNPKFEVHFKV